ncbi:VOC family protein [Streptomyces sp. NPDC001373]|uniref:VOC family protein n=1 Tax=Streptomyces sp. NPDC001373 TaxID=3364565 RepID=UPI0036B8AABF
MTAVWLELHTRNACDAAVFYGEVLEWAEHEVSGCCEVSYEEDQVVLRRGGRPVARWNSGPVEAAAARPQLRPRWLVHFRVPDLKAAQAAVVENAGVIVPDAAPWDEGKLRVTVSDPDGGLFTLDQTAPPAT